MFVMFLILTIFLILRKTVNVDTYNGTEGVVWKYLKSRT